jgi:hypothetical protein
VGRRRFRFAWPVYTPGRPEPPAGEHPELPMQTIYRF